MSYFIIWYVLGLFGCILAAYTDNKRGEDFTIIDFFLMLLVSAFGFFVLLMGVVHFGKYNLKNYVLIKGR